MIAKQYITLIHHPYSILPMIYHTLTYGFIDHYLVKHPTMVGFNAQAQAIHHRVDAGQP